MATMGPDKHVSGRRCLQSRRSRIILGVFVFIAILAVVIPPAVVVTLRKKNSMGPKANIFVPLYVYPAPGAWDPLEAEYVWFFFFLCLFVFLILTFNFTPTTPPHPPKPNMFWSLGYIHYTP